MNRRRFLFGVLAAAAAGKRVAVATPNAVAAERLRRDVAELARWMDEPITERQYGRGWVEECIGPTRRVTADDCRRAWAECESAAWWRVGFTA